MKILATMPFTDDDKNHLQQLARDCEFMFKNIGQVEDKDVSDIDILLGNIPAAVVSKAGNLK